MLVSGEKIVFKCVVLVYGYSHNINLPFKVNEAFPLNIFSPYFFIIPTRPCHDDTESDIQLKDFIHSNVIVLCPMSINRACL